MQPCSLPLSEMTVEQLLAEADRRLSIAQEKHREAGEAQAAADEVMAYLRRPAPLLDIMEGKR